MKIKNSYLHLLSMLN